MFFYIQIDFNKCVLWNKIYVYHLVGRSCYTILYIIRLEYNTITVILVNLLLSVILLKILNIIYIYFNLITTTIT